MRRAHQDNDDYPGVVLVSPAGAADAAPFFAAHWPEALVICDPEKSLYAKFGLVRGTLLQVLGPRVWWPGLRGLLRGHGVGKPKGDPLQMSGAFVVQGGVVTWAHAYRHSADHPDFVGLRAPGYDG